MKVIDDLLPYPAAASAGQFLGLAGADVSEETVMRAKSLHSFQQTLSQVRNARCSLAVARHVGMP